MLHMQPGKTQGFSVIIEVARASFSLPTEINYNTTRIMRGISNNGHVKQWEVIVHSCPTFHFPYLWFSLDVCKRRGVGGKCHKAIKQDICNDGNVI